MSGPSFHSYLSEANKESIFLTPTDQQEIHSIILNVKDSAPGTRWTFYQSYKPCDRNSITTLNIYNEFILYWRGFSPWT